ncbi:MAG: exonuclease SbcCD subunit D [Acidimicrobiales bacterium]
MIAKGPLRLLHTGDWHVGRTIRGRSRAEEHAATMDELVAVADDQQVQLVVVAGDLFDTAAPTPDAERLVYETLLRLAGTDRQVVVIAGNHDHPRRLAAVEPLLSLGRVHVRPFVVSPQQGGVIDLDLGGVPTRLAMLPWLSQRYAISAAELLERDADQHNQSYLDRVRAVTNTLCRGFDGSRVNLVVGHVTAVGGLLGGGERAAHTIFDYAVPASIFPPTANYVALGHLHRCQHLPSPAPTWYAGSPLQLDFGEGDNTPSCQIVACSPGLPARIETVELRAARRLTTLIGNTVELALQAAGAGDAHLRLVVREAHRAGLAEELRERFPNAVDVRVEAEPPDPRGATNSNSSNDTGGGRLGRAPHELFAEFLAGQHIEDPRLHTLFKNLVEADASEHHGGPGDTDGPDRPDSPSSPKRRGRRAA